MRGVLVVALKTRTKLRFRSLRHGAIAAFFVDLLLALLAMAALMLVASMIWVVLRGVVISLGIGGPPDMDSLIAAIGEPGVVALLLISGFSTGGAALLLYGWRRRASAEEIAASLAACRRTSTWGWAAAAGVATYLAGGSISALAQRWGMQPQPSNVAVIESGMDAYPALLIVFAIVVAPAYEELLFRRVLFGRLWSAGRPILGLVLSSFAFAALHEVPGVGGNSLAATLWLWLVYSAMGAAYAALYWRTGTLWAPIAAHALNNGLALGALKLYGGG